MRRLFILTVILSLAALVAGCSGSGAGSDDTTEVETTPAADGGDSDAAITIAGFAFSGAETVAVGDTVTITNEDGVAHTWTAVDDEFDSGSLAEGETFELTFDEAGEFDYFCAIHPSMTGTITVEG